MSARLIFIERSNGDRFKSSSRRDCYESKRLRQAQVEVKENSDAMPAGVSWGEYLKFLSVAMIFTLAGAQCVHVFYKPLEDIDALVEAEIQKRKKLINTEHHEKTQNT